MTLRLGQTAGTQESMARRQSRGTSRHWATHTISKSPGGGGARLLHQPQFPSLPQCLLTAIPSSRSVSCGQQ